MVALLNYREDGVTRTSIWYSRPQRLINDLVRSIHRLLEGWPQGGKALIFLTTSCSHGHEALTIMDTVSINSFYLSMNTLQNNKSHRRRGHGCTTGQPRILFPGPTTPRWPQACQPLYSENVSTLLADESKARVHRCCSNEEGRFPE